MWASLGKWLLQVLLIPLIKDGVTAAYQMYKDYQEKKKQEQIAKEAAKKLEQARSKNEARNAFNNLP